MRNPNPVMCPECGWTGDKSDLIEDGLDYACPVCSHVLATVD